MTHERSELATGSVWEQELFAHLTEHAEKERHLLEEYAAVAEATDSKALAFVVKLIIEDERRHHAIFDDLAASLKTDTQFASEDPAIPRMDFARADRASVRDLTKQLIARERQDLREMKQLQKDLHELKDSTLWSLLVDLMKRDTDKHIAILRFVQRHT